jgi:predicted dithiol-disulfide oxidoreductase (DUF899 family)
MLPVTASREEWLTARKELLIREKQLTHARDDVSQARRELPMVEVEESYAFDGPDGARTLLDLFEGWRQLIVHHFMWVWDLDDDGNETPQDTGCPSCSATADNIGNLAHLHARDTTLVAVSRAPYDKIAPFHARMGWTFPWYSSFGSSFNYDFHVTIDDRIAPVLLNFRDKPNLPRPATPGHRNGAATIRVSARSCARVTPSSTPTRRWHAGWNNPAERTTTST